MCRPQMDPIHGMSAPRHSTGHRPGPPDEACRARTTTTALPDGGSPPGAGHGDYFATALAAQP